MSQGDQEFSKEISHARQLQNLLAVSQKCDALLQMIGPTYENFKARQDTFKIIVTKIQQVIPSALLVPYGSFVSKCYLFNSDIDFCCWTPDMNQKESCLIVLQALQSIPDATSVQHIDADVPVVKCQINNVGVDVSFSQPSGLLTAYLLEVLDQIIGRNHIFKRSLVLVQNYFLNETHTLGSHNFMLSSYGLRTMVAFIILNQNNICQPLQTLIALTAYFCNFDFENNVVTIFGVMQKQQFERYPSAMEAIKDIQQKYLKNCNENQQIKKLIIQINHLISCRNACDEKLMQQLNYFDVVNQLFIQPDDQNKLIRTKLHDRLEEIIKSQYRIKYNKEFDQTQILQQERQQLGQRAVEKVITEFQLTKFITDDQQFQFKYINISDPLMPSNNIGRSVNLQNMLRMQRCMQQGFQQIQSMLNVALEGRSTIIQCCAEFDQLFLNTMTLLTMEQGELDFNVKIDQLFQGMTQIVSWAFGIKNNGVVYRLD